MTIIAKYSGTCPLCRKPIAPGQQVDWQRGAKATHVNCDDAPKRESWQARDRRLAEEATARQQEADRVALEAATEDERSAYWGYVSQGMADSDAAFYAPICAVNWLASYRREQAVLAARAAELAAYEAMSTPELVKEEVRLTNAIAAMQDTYPTMDYMSECIRWNEQRAELVRQLNVINQVLDRRESAAEQARDADEDRRVAEFKAARDAELSASNVPAEVLAAVPSASERAALDAKFGLLTNAVA